MKIGLVIYGSLDTLSGGYLYDRRLVEYLRAQGDIVQIISLPWRNYLAHLGDNFHFRLPPDLDLLIQDELNHPSLLWANRPPHPYPLISLVHHLRCSEQHPAWKNALYRIVERHYLGSVDGFIFNSDTTRQVVTGLIGEKKAYVVAYPPTDRFRSHMTKAEIEARSQSGPLRILFLGNLIRRKGLHTLLEALKLLSIPFLLDVVGSLSTDPGYANAMQRLTQVSGLSDKITFPGPLDDEDLAARFRSAHVLVVPSSYEGFGIVYLEGMAFGLPAIGTTAGAAPEIITDGQTGYLVPPDAPEKLAERLSGLAADRELLSRLSRNALGRYRLQPNWHETAGRIRDFLQGIIH